MLTSLGDVDLKQKRLTFRNCKAGEGPARDMNDVVIQTLQSLPRMLHNPDVFMVATVEGRSEGSEHGWKRYLRKRRSKTCQWHDLRPPLASRLVMKGS